MFALTQGSGRSRLGSAVALTAAVAIGGALLVGGPGAGAASPDSQATGTFLGGSVAGLNLNTIAQLKSANAVNEGGATVTEIDPLTVSLLSAITLPLGSTGLNLLGPNGILNVGAANQYAQATPAGASHAASGAVDNSGGITAGGSPSYPSNATVDLTGLIADPTVLTKASVTVGAVSATADLASPSATPTSSYQIAGLDLDVTSPLLAGLLTQVEAFQPVLDAVNSLGVITGLPNLTTLVSTVGTISVLGGGITADLATGVIHIDVEKILEATGLSLNSLTVDQEILPVVTTAIANSLIPAVRTALITLTGQISTAIHAMAINGIPIGVAAPTTLAGLLSSVLGPLQGISNSLGSKVGTPLVTALEGLISLQGNVQTTNANSFTDRALQLTLLQGGTSLAQVNLASATVGPNAGAPAIPAPTASSLHPNQGPVSGGQTVTITGTGFTSGATVTIGGKTVTPTNIASNGDSLTFVTPAHPAGPVSVTVTEASGTTAPLTYTYVPVVTTPAPTASSLHPNQGPVSGGQTVTITGTGFTSGATVTIGGKTVTPTNIASNGGSLTFVTPAHPAGPVSVTVTEASGTTKPLTYTYVPASTTLAPPVITKPTNGSTVTTPKPPIDGTGTPGGTVTVISGGTTVCTAKVASNGTWSCIPTKSLSPGKHTITATQKVGTKTSAKSVSVTFTVKSGGSTGGNPGGNSGSGNPSGNGNGGTPAKTGVDVLEGLAIALFLMVAGAGSTLLGRRRKSATSAVVA